MLNKLPFSLLSETIGELTIALSRVLHNEIFLGLIKLLKIQDIEVGLSVVKNGIL